jgi:hypothetical protein
VDLKKGVVRPERARSDYGVDFPAGPAPVDKPAGFGMKF